jgi:SAM-dependent methyltransferase
MTLEAYGAFYDGVYRPLVSAYHGRLIDAVTIQYEQSNYAVERGDLLAPILDRFETGTLLDIGGSTGVVAHAFAERFGVRATVLDPAPAEIDEAHTRGLEIVHGFAEAVDFGNRRFDLVTLCQTVDHLLDVQEILRRVRTLVTDGGVFFVDIVDFRSACHRAGSIEGAIKVDHPYYLVEETMVAFLEQAGFSVITADRASDGLHVSYVCRPEEPMPNACSPSGTAERLWRDIRSLRTRSAT